MGYVARRVEDLPEGSHDGRFAEALGTLTEQQRKFVLGIVGPNGLTPTIAAERAGYSAPHVAQHRLLRSRKIRTVLKIWNEERQVDHTQDIDKAVEQLRRIAFADLTPALEEGPEGNLTINISRLTKAQRAAIEISGPKNDLKIRQVPRLEALEKLARILGLYAEDRRDDAEAKLMQAAERLLGTAQGGAGPGDLLDVTPTAGRSSGEGGEGEGEGDSEGGAAGPGRLDDLDDDEEGGAP